MKKRIASILTAAVIGATAITTVVSAASGEISVVSREDGSGFITTAIYEDFTKPRFYI